MKKTLLEKAVAVTQQRRYRKSPHISDEALAQRLELVMAYLEGKITHMALWVASGQKRQQMPAYIGMTINVGVVRGFCKVTLTKG